MTLAQEILSTWQRIVLDVRVDGRVVPDVTQVIVTNGWRNLNAAAQVTVAGTRADWITERTSSSGQVVVSSGQLTIRAGYNNQSMPIFTGEIVGIDRTHYPQQFTIDARAVAWRLRLPWGEIDREYQTTEDPVPAEPYPDTPSATVVTDASLIRNLIEAYGIPNTQHAIESTGWILAVVEPIILKEGDASIGLIQEIDSLSVPLKATWVDSSGIVRRTAASGIPQTGAVWTFTEGVDILSARNATSIFDVSNRIRVRGLTYFGLQVEGIAEADNTNIPNPPGKITHDMQSNLVETDDRALAIATVQLAERNRKQVEAEITTVGNPLVQPGATVTVDHADVELAGNRFVEQVQHRISRSSFTSTFQLSGGQIATPEPQGLPPVPVINLLCVLEMEETEGGGLVNVVDVIADGSGSWDPDSAFEDLVLVSWAATITGGSLKDSPGTTAPTSTAPADWPVWRWFAQVDSRTDWELSVTLTIQDEQENEASVTVTYLPEDVQVEDLWSAEGGTVAVTRDGGLTWQEQTRSAGQEATCLAPFGPSWGMLWGCANGEIIATFDYLATAPVSLGSPAGASACTAVWAHEEDDTRLTAGFDDGRVYVGVLDVAAQSATWTLHSTLPAGGTINEVRESIDVFSDYYATSGSSGYFWAATGSAWQAVSTQSGGTAWRMSSGWDENAFSYTGTPTNPAETEEGITYDLAALDPAVAEIRALGHGWRVDEVYAVDAQQRYLRSGGVSAGSRVFAEIASGGGRNNHIIRSGNIDGLVYHALGDGLTNGGIQKSMRMDAPFYTRRTDARQVHMVGYGLLHDPPIKSVKLVRVLIPPDNAPLAQDVVWDTWTVYQLNEDDSIAFSGTLWTKIPLTNDEGGVTYLNSKRWYSIDARYDSQQRLEIIAVVNDTTTTDQHEQFRIGATNGLLLMATTDASPVWYYREDTGWYEVGIVLSNASIDGYSDDSYNNRNPAYTDTGGTEGRVKLIPNPEEEQINVSIGNALFDRSNDSELVNNWYLGIRYDYWSLADNPPNWGFRGYAAGMVRGVPAEDGASVATAIFADEVTAADQVAMRLLLSQASNGNVLIDGRYSWTPPNSTALVGTGNTTVVGRTGIHPGTSNVALLRNQNNTQMTPGGTRYPVRYAASYTSMSGVATDTSILYNSNPVTGYYLVESSYGWFVTDASETSAPLQYLVAPDLTVTSILFEDDEELGVFKVRTRFAATNIERDVVAILLPYVDSMDFPVNGNTAAIVTIDGQTWLRLRYPTDTIVDDTYLSNRLAVAKVEGQDELLILFNLLNGVA